MTKARPLIAAAVLLGFAALPLLLAPAGAQQLSDRTRQMGMKIKCMCGSCDMPAAGCSHPGGEFSGPCGTALAMLKEVDQRIAKGETDDQILQAFVQQYGTRVYAEPPKSGFSLVAWVMPSVYLALGTLVVIFVIARWVKRPAQESGSGGVAARTISPELLARAKAEAARQTEE
jgi:cytochrome c-type biogenesis CcmH protein